MHVNTHSMTLHINWPSYRTCSCKGARLYECEFIRCYSFTFVYAPAIYANILTTYPCLLYYLWRRFNSSLFSKMQQALCHKTVVQWRQKLWSIRWYRFEILRHTFYDWNDHPRWLVLACTGTAGGSQSEDNEDIFLLTKIRFDFDLHFITNLIFLPAEYNPFFESSVSDLHLLVSNQSARMLYRADYY